MMNDREERIDDRMDEKKNSRLRYPRRWIAECSAMKHKT